MKLIINGDEKGFPGEPTLADLMRDLELEQRPIAVELNLEVVPRDRHAATRLKEGDRLEIITLVGGG